MLKSKSLKVLVTAAVLAIVSSVTACAATEPLHLSLDNKYDDRRDDDGRLHVKVSYPEISLEENTGSNDPLKKAIENTSQELEEDAKAFGDEYQEIETFLSENNNVIPHSYEEELFVRRADTDIVSLYTVVSTYGGGAHGYYYYNTFNIDAETGEELALKDILQDGAIEKLPEIIETELLEKYVSSRFITDDLAGTIRNAWEGDGKIKFTLDPEGISFYFEPYYLTTYAGGGLIETFSYAEYPELVKDEYKTRPENYITAIPMGREVTVGAADGTETLEVDYTNAGDEEGRWSIIIRYGKKLFSQNIYANDCKAYLVRTGGKNFLYVETEEENEWKSLHIFDLNENEIVSRYFDDSRWFTDSIPTDPDEMELQTRVNILSTYNAHRTYKAGEDGIPAAVDAFDLISSKNKLTAKTQIEAEIREGASYEKSERQTIPAGTELSFYATDCESWIDMQTEDGKYVRFSVNSGSPRTVEGQDPYEIFAGMRFAG